jgi:hypothetical protein
VGDQQCWTELPEANRRAAVGWLAVLASRVVAVRLPGVGQMGVDVGDLAGEGGGHDLAMTALLPWERLGGKVGDRQLGRLAVVDVRQSTRRQVADHGGGPGCGTGWWGGRSRWAGRPRGCW